VSPLLYLLLVFALALGAGLLGSLLGLGGGIIVIPALTLLLGVDIKYAIGASVVSVIATSSGAAARYVRDHYSNIRVGMFLEVGTVSGALSGAFIGGYLSGRWLFFIFALVLAYSAAMMLRKRHEAVLENAPIDRITAALRLDSSYYDKPLGREVRYRVKAAPLGLGLSYVAGMVSGLLGIGGGAFKVPAMDLAMHLPIKVSTATSNFMIGVTAAASASVYFVRGQINPLLAAPVAVGVLLGATFGAQLMAGLPAASVRKAFFVVLVFVALQMAIKGIVY
jgi:uncharacterized protein